MSRSMARKGPRSFTASVFKPTRSLECVDWLQRQLAGLLSDDAFDLDVELTLLQKTTKLDGMLGDAPRAGAVKPVAFVKPAISRAR
jgi:hypothetical protein